ncbi:ethanolamine ammonia-lyase subunit EutC [Conexibacter stalactiti]|uniref:Ethanolamine ammonia-lyase small subunit n=1 Tax=Conexibacter stalactiti TaxID=1940611 RepID=A0ABU4HJE7_9ACTN|nr:ethanolamine ammonia-lyase subunit EutC [Conexibacter stalactiti]MDW5593438.1 ethanolamine ammonia-lyase subunit EutC [Conexibacter stalactiti]MEC5034079.1 ethanolamine ammonia-lyase subunit EutC [Conexibacter stalactiti]
MSGRDELVRRVRAATPARVFEGGVAGGATTESYLRLRADHAAARDAVRAPLDLEGGALGALAAEVGLFAVASQATSHEQHLLRPDLGRQLAEADRAVLRDRCPAGADLQLVVGDGLSATAVHAQVPTLLPELTARARRHGWSVGQPFAVRFARVGVLNEIGDLLRPRVVVLLIGERPGLTTAESLSAYLALRPRPGHTDADRNLISNIHAGGTPPAQAADRIVRLAAALVDAGVGGHAVKEPAIAPPPVRRLDQPSRLPDTQSSGRNDVSQVRIGEPHE